MIEVLWLTKILTFLKIDMHHSGACAPVPDSHQSVVTQNNIGHSVLDPEERVKKHKIIEANKRVCGQQ